MKYREEIMWKEKERNCPYVTSCESKGIFSISRMDKFSSEVYTSVKSIVMTSLAACFAEWEQHNFITIGHKNVSSPLLVLFMALVSYFRGLHVDCNLESMYGKNILKDKIPLLFKRLPCWQFSCNAAL